ncbi:MAG: GTP-binding protein [Promethearchaeota archaeon]
MSVAPLLETLLNNYMKEVLGVKAIAICDREGLIISSVKREEAESEDVLGAISAVIDSYIERIKNEFGTESTFLNITSTGNKKFVYCSQGPHSILTTIADLSTTDTELTVYSEHIAKKVELLLEGNENVSLEIPAIIKAISKMRDGKLPSGEFSLKLILTGNYKVGKTSLINRFIHNKFQESYISTIGVEISKKVVTLGEANLNFIIWDIAGQFQTMAPYRARFYNGANAAFIVIDRTREDLLESIRMWHNDIKNSVQIKIPIIIVGNKSDLENEIVISEEQIKKIADEYRFHYILTSAKTGENVNDAFLYVAYKYLESA